MKLLIVAHPDDEILWFNPEEFDKIVVVFGDREDRIDFGERRRIALKHHPLAHKIEFLNFREPGKDAMARTNAYDQLKVHLRLHAEGVLADSITTHNAMGEYQHPDHLMLFNICMGIFDCPVNGKNPAIFRAAKQAYIDAGCWTWH